VNPREFFVKMAQFESTGVLTLSPGPFRIKVGEHDIYAAQLLDSLGAEYDEKTLGEFEGVLLGNVIQRLFDMAAGQSADGEDEGEIVVDAEVWRDDLIQTFLTAWWWTVFFAARHGIDQDDTEEETS